MSESNTRAEILQVIGKTLAASEAVSYSRYKSLFDEQAEEILTALEASGRAVVPRRALEQIVNLSDCGFAVDVAEQALAAAPYRQAVVKDTTQ